jgi:Arc/MetJ-type ribon-helix-helix transcriptional regulator
MPKRTKTISIDSRLIDWVNSEIEKKEFSSLSHAVEKALYELKRSYETKKS